MYTFTHVFIILINAVMWSLIVAGLAWAPKLAKANETYTCLLVVLLRSIFFTMFSYWGMIFLDSFVKIMFLGPMSYGNIGYYLSPMFLALISGIIVIIGCVFIAPTVKTLINFVVLQIVYGYFFWFTGYTNLGERDGIYIPMIYIIGIEMMIGLCYIGIRYVLHKNPLIDNPLWNLSAKFKSIITPPVIIVLWILNVIEFISLWEGYSFFAFGTGIGNTIQILIDIGTIIICIIAAIISRRYFTMKYTKT